MKGSQSCQPGLESEKEVQSHVLGSSTLQGPPHAGSGYLRQGGPGEPFSGIWAVSPTQAPADALAEVRGLFLLLVPARSSPGSRRRPVAPLLTACLFQLALDTHYWTWR